VLADVAAGRLSPTEAAAAIAEIQTDRPSTMRTWWADVTDRPPTRRPPIGPADDV
jgi:hypothetical protein